MEKQVLDSRSMEKIRNVISIAEDIAGFYEEGLREEVITRGKDIGDLYFKAHTDLTSKSEAERRIASILCYQILRSKSYLEVLRDHKMSQTSSLISSYNQRVHFYAQANNKDFYLRIVGTDKERIISNPGDLKLEKTSIDVGPQLILPAPKD